MIFLTVAFAILLIGAALFLFRQNKKAEKKHPQQPTTIDAGCCGAHAVCEKESLLANNNQIIYYDDEELDLLAGIPASEMSEQEMKQIEDIFFTLQEKDVAGWLRSLQLRNIELPDNIREEALLIVAERRAHK